MSPDLFINGILPVFLLIALGYILTPLIFVTWLAFFRQEIPSFPPEGYSLVWYGTIPGNDRFVSGFILSLQVAVIATLIGLAIGVPAALAIDRWQGAERVQLRVADVAVPDPGPGVVR